MEPDQNPHPAERSRPTESPYRWYHKVSSLLFAIFCFELGVFLIVSPWTDIWDRNLLASLNPATVESATLLERWRALWLNPYFRGAVSGIGLLNIVISLGEVYRLRRFSRHDDSLE